MRAVMAASRSPRRFGPAALLTLALDVLIVIQLLIVLAIVIAGAFSLAWARAHWAAKPLLILIACAAVRIALPAPSYQHALQSGSWYQSVRSAWQRLRIPPALSDVIGVVLITRVAAVALAFFSNVLLPDQRFR